MIAVKPLFKPGQILVTPGCLEKLEEAGQSFGELLQRHLAGDWGVVCPEDAEANTQALKDGSRLLSAYVLKTGEKVWIITEAEDDNGNRAATSGLRPCEY
jgi:hypothetical protein